MGVCVCVCVYVCYGSKYFVVSIYILILKSEIERGGFHFTYIAGNQCAEFAMVALNLGQIHYTKR